MPSTDLLYQRLTEIGIEKGIEQGIERIAVNMMKKGVARKLIVEVTGLSDEKLDELESTALKDGVG